MAIRAFLVRVADEPFLDTVDIQEALELGLTVDSYLANFALNPVVLLAIGED